MHLFHHHVFSEMSLRAPHSIHIMHYQATEAVSICEGTKGSEQIATWKGVGGKVNF